MEKIFAAVAAILLCCAPAQAGIITLTVNEVGGDVVVDGSGTLDITGRSFLNAPTTMSHGGYTSSFEYAYGMGPGWDYVDDFSAQSGGARLIGTTYIEFQTSGDQFGWNFPSLRSRIFFDSSLSGTMAPVDFTWTFSNQTTASLGTIFGTVFSGRNTLKVVEGSLADVDAQVPVPAALPLFLVGLGGLAAVRRRRR